MLVVSIEGGYSWAGNVEFGVSVPGKPQTGSPKIYTIYNISMDEVASTSRKASRVALKKAQRVALEKLFRKIIREEDHKQLPQLGDGQVTELVSGIELANEKTSHVRYIADFTIHFSRDKIYNFLSARQIPFAETLSSPASILTVLEEDGAVVLWERNNAWRRAWTEYDTANNLVPIQVLAPSSDNRMAITAWQAQQGSRELLKKLAAKKGINKLYIMSAHVENDFVQGSRTIDLSIFSNDEEQSVFRTTIVAESSADDLSSLYDKAIEQATYWLDNQWKEKVMIHFGTSSHLNVNIKYDRSDDWFEIKKRLESISLIRKLTYRHFKISAAEVEMEHSGDVNQIILTLAQEDLILTEQTDNMKFPQTTSWVLTLKK